MNTPAAHFPQATQALLAVLILILAAGCAGSRQMNVDNRENNGNGQPAVGEQAGYQQDRLLPNPIDEEVPHSFYRAVNEQTRTFSGKPGENYWQQWANYDLDVTLDVQDNKLYGKGTITYHNNSPDTLGQLLLELTQNVHKEGVERKEHTEITGGVNISHVAINRDSLSVIEQRGQPGYFISGTAMVILPRNPLMPGDSVTLDIDWDFNIPRQGASGRMGHNNEDLFYIAYWYPQMRVYDDINGWFTDPFLLNAEFYHGFANYRVDITVPEQWLVASTGKLKNAKEVLRTPIYEQMTQAYQSDDVKTVVGMNDFGNFTKSAKDSLLTWTYEAENVRDFAFSASRASVWDAARTPVGDRDGDGETEYAEINAIYHGTAALWKDAVSHSQHSLTFLSEYTGLPYPWPHMTAVEGGGIIGTGGGMEFPMMTLIGSYKNRSAGSLYAVIAHELAHMWVPMQVSTNERRYSWIDEGTTSFNENQAELDRYPKINDFEIEDFNSYLQIAGSDIEGPVMRWSDYHYYSYAFGVASYSKPASLLTSLRGLLGEDIFQEALQTFMENWRYKHPTPWDFFNTFEDISGRNLDWFWRSWYYETWTLDHSVAGVNATEEGTRILIQDLGLVPMPTHVKITYANGNTEKRTIEVDTWLQGSTTAILTTDNNREVTKVEIDPEYLFPDVNRSNNVWQKKKSRQVK